MIESKYEFEFDQNIVLSKELKDTNFKFSEGFEENLVFVSERKLFVINGFTDKLFASLSTPDELTEIVLSDNFNNFNDLAYFDGSYYAITDKGKKILAKEKEEWMQFSSAVNQVLTFQGV